LRPEMPPAATGAQLLIAFRLDTAKPQGFRGLRLTYRYHDRVFSRLIQSAFTVCGSTTTPLTTVGNQCGAYELPPLGS
jgi:hypothetical protein